MGEELTSDAFREALYSAPWIHYHGHAYYERSEGFKQCFVPSPKIRPQAISWGEAGDVEISTGGANPVQTTQPVELEPTFRPKAMLSAYQEFITLAVSEIFALNLSKNNPVICSIACDSGLQDIAAGDEPLGLVTALLCAGASSVLGTLWPFRSDTGRSFTIYFYKSIDKQRKVEEAKDSKVKVVNLALAVREASLEPKKEKADLYTWAALVLHDAGFYLYQ